MMLQLLGLIGVASSVAIATACFPQSGLICAADLAEIKGGALCERPTALATSGCTECQYVSSISSWAKCAEDPPAKACVRYRNPDQHERENCSDFFPYCGGMKTVYSDSQCTQVLGFSECQRTYNDAMPHSGTPGTCP